MPARPLAFGRNILLLAIVMILGSLATNLISPLWPLYIINLGASMTELGFVFGLSNAVGALLQVPSGMLSDRYGRRCLHALGSCLSVLPPFFYALARSWAELIPWVLLSGVAMGLYAPLRFSMIADETSVEQRARAYSWANIAFLVGPTIGPSLGGIVADTYGIRASFYVTGLLLAGSFATTLWLTETHNPNGARRRGKGTVSLTVPVLSTALLALFGVNAVQGVAVGLFSPVTPVFVTDRFAVDLTFVGALYAVGFGLSSLLGQIPGGRIADRWDRRMIVVTTGIASAPFWALFALSASAGELMAYMCLANGVLSLSWPALQALAMELTPRSSWGFVNGLTSSGFWAGMTVGSTMSGFIWDAMGANVPYYVSALVMLVSVFPALFLKQPSGGRSAERAQQATQDEC